LVTGARNPGGGLDTGKLPVYVRLLSEQHLNVAFRVPNFAQAAGAYRRHFELGYEHARGRVDKNT
jgi:hypothetical protein